MVKNVNPNVSQPFYTVNFKILPFTNVYLFENGNIYVEYLQLIILKWSSSLSLIKAEKVMSNKCR